MLYPTVEDLIKLENYIEAEIRRDQYFWKNERHASFRRRSVDSLLEIKEKPYKFKSYNKKRDFLENMRKISSQKDLTYRWLAEMGSSVYSNSEKIPKAAIIKALKRKFAEIKKDSSQSNNHESEKKEIRFVLDLLKKMSVDEIIHHPKLGNKYILKPILGSRYKERIQSNYKPEEMKTIHREASEEEIKKSLIYWDKFIAASV
ncbi:MAG: hypothetical protein WCC52_09115 [Nitrosotalea sp.]